MNKYTFKGFGVWTLCTITSNNGEYEFKTRLPTHTKEARYVSIYVNINDEIIIRDNATGQEIQIIKASKILINDEFISNAEWFGYVVKCKKHKLEFNTNIWIKNRTPVNVNNINGTWVINTNLESKEVEYNKILSVIYDESEIDNVKT